MTPTIICARCARDLRRVERLADSWEDSLGQMTCPAAEGGAPHQPAAQNITWHAKIMVTRWTAMPNDVIGGWCVMAGDKPPSVAREPEVADFTTREAAEHIADLHNAWLHAANDHGRVQPGDPDEALITQQRWDMGDISD